MFNLLQGPQVRLNEGCEGFGYNDDAEGLPSPISLPGIAGTTGAAFQTVMFKPLCGLLNETKYIPLRYCLIEIELELADNDEPIVSQFGTFSAVIITSYGILSSVKSNVTSYP
jgi:hypothetical protein